MILLARHGETPYNAERRFQGQGDVALNARGLEQARELAQLAVQEPLAALYASPIRRARETAEIVAEAVGLEPRFDPRFAETDVGDWQDLLFDDVEREHPDLWAAWQAGGAWRFPGGESLAEQQERVIAGLVDVTQRGELPALVVCHRGSIRVALCHTRNEGLEAFQQIAIPNGALIRL
ncbi:histidine phosphatase family protein [Capillimicrobium parvum]|uniref:Phosphoserine phosphatase 1 n=1 Tax=Capillimicrobium parvum TaxID=2884022 RepID=A0A9E6XTF5_9ACTN|nr:histidine phosphatase family protein [Capillimicrobium parvum]UGS33773.1 Phosphoserine phosphatase 1 [Capillimicrobium parvum]